MISEATKLLFLSYNAIPAVVEQIGVAVPIDEAVLQNRQESRSGQDGDGNQLAHGGQHLRVRGPDQHALLRGGRRGDRKPETQLPDRLTPPINQPDTPTSAARLIRAPILKDSGS